MPMLRFVTCYIFDKFSEQSIQVIVSSDNAFRRRVPRLADSVSGYRPIPTIPSLSILLRIISCSSQSKNLIDRRLRDLRDWILERLGKRCSRYEKEEKKEKNIIHPRSRSRFFFEKRKLARVNFSFTYSPHPRGIPARLLANSPTSSG